MILMVLRARSVSPKARVDEEQSMRVQTVSEAPMLLLGHLVSGV